MAEQGVNMSDSGRVTSREGIRLAARAQMNANNSLNSMSSGVSSINESTVDGRIPTSALTKPGKFVAIHVVFSILQVIVLFMYDNR